ncbi:MAG: cupin domain-containing protein [Gammaproteobacteria bacterium]
MALENYYPRQIRELEPFEGQFDAYRLPAEGADVLFASYPAGTVIPPHTHDTDNVGIISKGLLLLTMDGVTSRIEAGEWYHVPRGKQHAAEFPEDTAEIEFWFRDIADGK